MVLYPTQPNPKIMAMPLACAPLLRIASIECFFGFSVCVVVDVVIISQIDCIQCVSCELCSRESRGKGSEWKQSKGDPNIRVWGVVISNRTDFSVAVVCLLVRSFVCLFVFFCFVLWIRQNTTNPRSDHYNKLNGLCDTHTHIQPKQSTTATTKLWVYDFGCLLIGHSLGSATVKWFHLLIA